MTENTLSQRTGSAAGPNTTSTMGTDVDSHFGPEVKSDQWYQIKFTGTGFEFFKIWIVNLLLTLLTVGIYSAWATVRTRRYFYGNTTLSGSQFDFHGTALQILIGRIIALALLLGWSQGHLINPSLPMISIAIVVSLFPWFMVRALRFRLRNTSLLNLRFNFSGTTAQAYKLLGGYMIIFVIISVGFGWFIGDFIANPGQQPTMSDVSGMLWLMLFSIVAYLFLYPSVVRDVRVFLVNNASFGDQGFSVKLERRAFIITFLKAVLMFIALSVVALVLGAIVAGVGVGISAILNVDSLAGGFDPGLFEIVFLSFGFYVLFGLAAIIPSAYWQVFIFNETFRHLGLPEQVKFKAQLKTKSLVWLLITNTLMVLFSLGFAYPWAVVRLAKYKLEGISYQGDLSVFEGRSMADNSALGEEVGEAFDIEFGL